MKAIVEIDIPTDYIDDYKKWRFDGGLYYLEDGAWTHLKDIECELKPTDKAIPIEWIKDYVDFGVSDELAQRNRLFVLNMIKDWEKENER